MRYNCNLLTCSFLVLLSVSHVAGWVQALSWAGVVANQVTDRHPNRSCRPRSNTACRQSVPPLSDLDGKTLYQRVFYRFSPGSEVDLHNAVIVEERVRFQPDPDRLQEGYVQPVGPRTLILRDGQVPEGEIGDEFFILEEVHDTKATHNGAGNDPSLEATLATALYLASNPNLIVNHVMEVGCHHGLASLIGCIGAGYAARKKSDTGIQTTTTSAARKASRDVADDILTVPGSGQDDDTLFPEALSKLTLSDSSEDSLNLAVKNIKACGITTSKVDVDLLDWSVRAIRPRTMGKSHQEYFTMIASDMTFSYPEAKELARTVANRLEPLGPYLYAKAGTPFPTFVHVCPDGRDDVPYLHRILEKGYRMSVATKYLKLEKLTFVPQSLPFSEPESKLDELELELQQFKEVVYQCLTAQHHPDYAGQGSGELFFPMETGEYEAAGWSAFMEPDLGSSSPW